jgi:hypothetical protein
MRPSFEDVPEDAVAARAPPLQQAFGRDLAVDSTLKIPPGSARSLSRQALSTALINVFQRRPG